MPFWKRSSKVVSEEQQAMKKGIEWIQNDDNSEDKDHDNDFVELNENSNIQTLVDELNRLRAEIHGLKHHDLEEDLEDAIEEEKSASQRWATRVTRPLLWCVIIGWIGLMTYYTTVTFRTFIDNRSKPATVVTLEETKPPYGLAFPVITVCNEGLGKLGSQVISFDKFSDLFANDYGSYDNELDEDNGNFESLLHQFTDCPSHDLVGDGYCDDSTNIDSCNWDGGDCCASTNGKKVNKAACSLCECEDPSASNDVFIPNDGSTFSNFHDDIKAPESSDDCDWDMVEDGICDDHNNFDICEFDGGDCCGDNNKAYCTECHCRDPDYDGHNYFPPPSYGPPSHDMYNDDDFENEENDGPKRIDDCQPSPCSTHVSLTSTCVNVGHKNDMGYVCAVNDCEPNPCLIPAACLNIGSINDNSYRCTTTINNKVDAKSPSKGIKLKMDNADFDEFVGDIENNLNTFKRSIAELLNSSNNISSIVKWNDVVVMEVVSGSVEITFFIARNSSSKSSAITVAATSILQSSVKSLSMSLKFNVSSVITKKLPQWTPPNFGYGDEGGYDESAWEGGDDGDDGSAQEDEGNEEDDGSAQEDEGNEEDDGSAQEDEGNEEDDGSAQEDEGKEEDDGNQNDTETSGGDFRRNEYNSEQLSKYNHATFRRKRNSNIAWYLKSSRAFNTFKEMQTFKRSSRYDMLPTQRRLKLSVISRGIEMANKAARLAAKGFDRMQRREIIETNYIKCAYQLEDPFYRLNDNFFDLYLQHMFTNFTCGVPLTIDECAVTATSPHKGGIGKRKYSCQGVFQQHLRDTACRSCYTFNIGPALENKETSSRTSTTTSNRTETTATVWEVEGCSSERKALPAPYHAFYSGSLNDISIRLNFHKDNYTDNDLSEGVRIYFSDPDDDRNITDVDVTSSPYTAIGGMVSHFSLKKTTETKYVQTNMSTWSKLFNDPPETSTSFWEASIAQIRSRESEVSDSVVKLSFSYAQLSEEKIQQKFTDSMVSFIGSYAGMITMIFGFDIIQLSGFLIVSSVVYLAGAKWLNNIFESKTIKHARSKTMIVESKIVQSHANTACSIRSLKDSISDSDKSSQTIDVQTKKNTNENACEDLLSEGLLEPSEKVSEILSVSNKSQPDALAGIMSVPNSIVDEDFIGSPSQSQFIQNNQDDGEPIQDESLRSGASIP